MKQFSRVQRRKYDTIVYIFSWVRFLIGGGGGGYALPVLAIDNILCAHNKQLTWFNNVENQMHLC